MSKQPDTPSSPTRDQSRSRGRGVVFWLGLGLVLAGAAVLGWVAWQFWGTNWVAYRDQHRQVQTLEQAWDQGQRLRPAEAHKGQAGAIVRIPRFGASYAVPVLEGTTEANLAQGFVHFPKTADPGGRGNYAIAAHRVTHGEPLARMPELRPGDQVTVETGRRVYTYRLDTDPNRLIVPFTAGWVLERVPHNPHAGGVQPLQRKHQRLLTMVTCSEIFHTDNRMVVFGHLVSVHPRR